MGGLANAASMEMWLNNYSNYIDGNELLKVDNMKPYTRNQEVREKQYYLL